MITPPVRREGGLGGEADPPSGPTVFERNLIAGVNESVVIF
jgi:hypothetical protein